jgi:CRP/FNR family transcriptional regulator, anaerobic regulatory protein
MIAVSSLVDQRSSQALQGANASAGLPPLPAALAVGLSARDLRCVDAARPSFRTLKAGASLYFQGDECRNIYLLLDGWAFRHQSLEDGRRQILDFALPGSAFGLAGSAMATHGVEALTPCRFSVFGRDNLCALMQQVPVLALRFIELLAGAEARAFEHLTSIGRRAARERVANLMLELLLRARQLNSTGQTPRMTLPLMQPHIADALGLASETVCRTLAAMRKDGIVVLRAQKLDVLDIDRLAAEAGISLDHVSAAAGADRGKSGPSAWLRSHMERLPACARAILATDPGRQTGWERTLMRINWRGRSARPHSSIARTTRWCLSSCPCV